MTNQIYNQSIIPSTDVIQLTLTLKMTTAQVVETSVTVNNNSSIQDYVHPNDQTQPTFETVLHWTTRLMVFPRNAGLGRCYLVSTRHEILSNIDRNLTGTLLRLRKNRNKINPARVRIPSSFESQTVVFQLFDFHLRKFKKFIIKKFYFNNQTCQHSTWQWLVVGDSPRGQLGLGIGQARIHTVFHRLTQIGTIFRNKYIFSNKNAFQVEIWKMLDSPCLMSTTKWKLTLMK